MKDRLANKVAAPYLLKARSQQNGEHHVTVLAVSLSHVFFGMSQEWTELRGALGGAAEPVGKACHPRSMVKALYAEDFANNTAGTLQELRVCRSLGNWKDCPETRTSPQTLSHSTFDILNASGHNGGSVHNPPRRKRCDTKAKNMLGQLVVRWMSFLRPTGAVFGYGGRFP